MLSVKRDFAKVGVTDLIDKYMLRIVVQRIIKIPLSTFSYILKVCIFLGDHQEMRICCGNEKFSKFIEK